MHDEAFNEVLNYMRPHRAEKVDDNIILVPGAKHSIFIVFEKKKDYDARLVCTSIKNFDSEYAKGIYLCNELNKLTDWGKFFLDADNEIFWEMRFYINEDNVCDQVITLLINAWNTLDYATKLLER